MEKEKRRQLAAEYKLQKVTGGVYAVRNPKTGTFFMKADTNLEGSRNRFEFSKLSGCMFHQLRREWDQYGADAFEFVILEETAQKETESPTAFKDRLKEMEAAWREKLETEKNEKK